MKRSTLLVGFFILLAIGVSVVQIGVSTALTTSGVDLSAVDAQKTTIEKDNMVLKEKVYAISSLTHIAQVASTMGLTVSKAAPLVMSAPIPVAFKQ